jgi:hypothetical protein
MNLGEPAVGPTCRCLSGVPHTKVINAIDTLLQHLERRSITAGGAAPFSSNLLRNIETGSFAGAVHGPNAK